MNRSALITLMALTVLPVTAPAQAGAQRSKSRTTSATPPPSRQASPRVWPDEGPRYWTPRPTVAAITANDLRTRLYQLADDSMQGRRVGEPGNFMATTYIAHEFAKMGLKPGGDGGTWFQNLPWGPMGFDQGDVTLAAHGTPFAPGVDWYPSAPSAFNGEPDSVALIGVTAVFAGTVGDTTVVLDPAVFRGRIAVFVGPSRDDRGAAAGRGGDGPPMCERVGIGGLGGAGAAIAAAKARGTTRTVRRGRGGAGFGLARDDRAQQAGAVAELIIDPEFNARAAAAAFTPRNGMQPAFNPTRPGLATLTAGAGARLFGKSIEQLRLGDSTGPVTANWTYRWRMSATPGRNVIAILPGSDPALKGEYVLVGAHNDHNGINRIAVDHDSLRAYNMVVRPEGANDPVCTPTAEQQHEIDSLIAHARSIRPPRRDSIMNGADDDGSGTAVLMEIAQAFSHEHPARSIIFISHVGEEAGLLGSAWFTAHPTIPLDSVVAAHNMDMLGKGRVTEVPFGGPNSVQVLGSRRLSTTFGDIIDSVNAISPAPMAIDRSWDVPENPLNRFCRSDQVNYVHHNIPVTYFSLGYALDYHQPTDEPQYVDYDHGARLGRWIHEIMTAIADRHDRPVIDGPNPDYPTCR